MIKDKGMWEECAAECPGMNKGKLWSFEEIEENKNKYVANRPMTRAEVEKLF